MFESIENKKILITGAASGIGSCIAKLFAEKGAVLGLHYHKNKKGAVLLQKEIQKLSGRSMLLKGDLTKVDVCRKLIRLFVKQYGAIDILINNAGAAFQYIYFKDLTEKTWNQTFDLNVRAPFYLSGEAFEHMKVLGGGKIINISSTAVKYGGSSRGIHYAAAKSALDTLTVGFAREGAKHSILVNSIRCGLINTSMRTKIKGYNEAHYRARLKLIPLGRAGDPLEVAQMVLFLASDCGNFITGEIFTVAGGD